MPGKTKQDECDENEQDIKEHAYYYDDAQGYEEYDPEKADDDEEEDQSIED
jgi:hypothetical protein